MALGERIRQLRKEHGWSQADLGERIGTDSQRVSRYETGRISPSIATLVAIAEAFNASIDYLLVDDIARRPLHAPESTLGDRLTNLNELDDTALDTLRDVIDGLVAKTRLRNLTRDIS